jgi:hypothetical protein
MHRNRSQRSRIDRPAWLIRVMLAVAAIVAPCWSAISMTASVVLIAAWAACWTASPATAQPPGSLPPREAFDQRDGEIPVRGFIFLNESGSQVMMPGMTWEDYERWLNAESDLDEGRQPYSFQSLDIRGSTDDGRAEMDVILKLSLESTGDGWVKVPLQMGNFHLLAPPDVSGIDEYSITLEPETSGYVLAVKTANVTDAMVRMKVSCRVENQSIRAIDMRLPDVPSRIELTVDASRVNGEIVGRGDETITTGAVGDQRTQFLIESGGGNFSLRFGKLSRSNEDQPLLEVESRLDVRWDSPQDQPIVSVRLTIRNAKGAIDGLQLRLPADSVVLDTPRLGTGGRAIEFGQINPDETDIAVSNRNSKPDQIDQIRVVTIPENERQQRIDLNFDLQLAADNTSPQSPLMLTAPEVLGALRHRGEIVIQTGGDYRLRWRTRPWVRSEPTPGQDESLSSRLYRFRFDRGSFQLPLWLSAKERQLRVNSQSTLSIRDDIAALRMNLQVSGQASDERLQLSEAGWTINAIENADTGELVESFRSDSHIVIDFNLGAAEESVNLAVLAERPLSKDLGDVSLPLPHVTVADENVLVQNATLDLRNVGRTLLVVDLNASSGLTRLPTTALEVSDSSSTFRLLSPDQSPTLVGTLVDQPPRITLSSEATVELDGDQLRSTVDWIVSSPLDLEGRLPIRIPKPVNTAVHSATHRDADGGADASATADQGASGSTDMGSPGSPSASIPSASIPSTSIASTSSPSTSSPSTSIPSTSIPSTSIAGQGDRFDGGTATATEPWVVTVDGVPATLRSLDDDRFELISERLSSGTMAIRWRHARSRSTMTTSRSTESVSMPRPNIADVTVRGSIRVTLRGNEQYELTSTDRPPLSVLELDTMPRDPLRLRLQSRAVTSEDIIVRQALLRSIVGRSTRQEQVIATIQGGDTFRVELPFNAPEVRTLATLDMVSVPVQRQGDTLTIPLSGDRGNHVVNLTVWMTMRTPPSVATVAPVLRLPVGVGRVFWQIAAPNDGHVLWASPTVGRSMAWRFDGWKLYREPSHSDASLDAMFGIRSDESDAVATPNRYLYVGSDLPSFEVILVSRTVLWICVGSFVLTLSVLLTNVPKTRHPLTVVVIAVLFAGLLAIAPDAAVLAGQLGMISLVLVIVMIAIRSLVSPSPGDRVFSSSKASVSVHPSTRSMRDSTPDSPSVTRTEALVSPTESVP